MLLLMCSWATPSIVYEQHNYPHCEAGRTIDMEHYEVTAMDDITEFKLTESHKKALLDEDKANHDFVRKILQQGLAPKVVASFSTTKTEVFAETNCCRSLLGQ
ncbi:hypothetical protein MKW92_017423 [Papaver armeniacum]|nr:hypothetical protein MKW92_017423 [Papaver armeniacum]